MLFPLKLQGDNRKKALTVDPAEGKTGKSSIFHRTCGDETTIYYNRANSKLILGNHRKGENQDRGLLFPL